MTIYHPDDQPVYTHELTGTRTTNRVTVDEIDGVPWVTVTTESNAFDGPMVTLDLRTVPGMTQREAIVANLDAWEQALRAHDAIEREQERQAAA